MTAIHAVHGFIASGKTTLARHLALTVPALHLNSDDIMVTLHGQDPPEHVYRPALPRVQAVVRDIAQRCLQTGTSVVLDDGYWTRASRDELRAWAARIGVPLSLYALNVPDDEALRRLQLRNAGSGLTVTPETFRLFRTQLERPGPDEQLTALPDGYPAA